MRDKIKVAMVSFAVLATAASLRAFPPSQSSWYWECPFHSLTGWLCPGCGGTRAVAELLRGDFASAMALNPVAVILVLATLAFAFVQALYLWRKGKFIAVSTPSQLTFAALTAIFLFTIVRNLERI
jgi:hypothetical protein